MGQDLNNDRGHNDDLFAATPPLAASRYLVSRMASCNPNGLVDLHLMALDISKAFLYCDVKREVYVELPGEDSRKSLDYIGLLHKSMHGLRDAPLIWQGVVRDMLEARGFSRLVATPCTFVHRTSGVLIVAHVDDFLVLGRRSDLISLRDGLADEEHEGTGAILGHDECDVLELQFLGRTIRLTDEGLEWSGDDKHPKAYLQKLVAESGPEGAEKLSDMGMVRTPGVKRDESSEVRVPLAKGQAKAYRGMAVLGNYMGQDRPDISFCAKEITKSMSSPCLCDIPALKRLGRYLRKYPVCVLMYYWQSPRRA